MTSQTNKQDQVALQQELKTIVRGVYALQKLRIQTGNRIVAAFKSKLGIKPSEKESESSISKKDKTLLENIKLAYKNITEGIVDPDSPLKDKFPPKENPLITNRAELSMVSTYMRLSSTEQRQFKDLVDILDDFPIWTEFLSGVQGIGPAIAAVIISELNPKEADFAASFWKYAGLDVVLTEGENGEVVGEGRCKKASHLIDVEYTTKEGKTATKKSITFNPFLKTKLCGVLGPSFLKQGSRSKYEGVYREYREWLDTSDRHREKTKIHKYRMSIRYMVKAFLVDLYIQWRTLEGLPINHPFKEN